MNKLWNIGTAVVILVLLGYWMDGRFHSSQVFTLVGAGLGVLYTFYEAWSMLK